MIIPLLLFGLLIIALLFYGFAAVRLGMTLKRHSTEWKLMREALQAARHAMEKNGWEASFDFDRAHALDAVRVALTYQRIQQEKRQGSHSGILDQRYNIFTETGERVGSDPDPACAEIKVGLMGFPPSSIVHPNSWEAEEIRRKSTTFGK